MYELNGQMPVFTSLRVNQVLIPLGPSVIFFWFIHTFYLVSFLGKIKKSRSMCSNPNGRWWETFLRVFKLSFRLLSGCPLLIAKVQFNSRLANELRFGS